MDIVERARAMVVNPGPTWVTIEQEVTDWQKLYVPYLVILALIPAVCTFIGMSVIGMGGFGYWRVPIFTGLGIMVSQYIMTLVMVFVWGWIISLLATTFGGQPNLMNAVKLTVYGSTPALLAGVFHLIPGLSMLALLGAFYSLYVIYLGLPVLMKNPADKSVAYLAVVAVACIVGGVIIAAANSIFMPSPMSRMRSFGGATPNNFQISTPKGDVQFSATPGSGGSPNGAAVTIKTADGEIKIDAQNMEDMAKRVQAMAAAQQQAAMQRAAAQQNATPASAPQ